MKKKLEILGGSLVIVLMIMAAGKSLKEEQIIFINEVRCWDSSTTRTGYYGSDYIELYNDSDQDISLNGWYLSDDAEDLKKCQLHDVMIEAKGYVLLYANGTADIADALNFKINPLGEKIILSDSKGNLVDSIYVPEQEFGTVYARMMDGSDEWHVKTESTGYSNNNATVLPRKCLDEPLLSHESGFYEEPFVLTMMADKGQEIYYTLDGSQPAEDAQKYEDGILIEKISQKSNDVKAVVVRALAKDKAGNCSEVATRTYFVGLQQYQNQNVISIVADYEDMFGDEGIFVTGKEYDEGKREIPNFLQSGRSWEINGNLQVLENGIETVNQEVGIRTQGASSRYADKKKMSIYSREEYSGNNYFDGLTLGSNQIHSIYTNHSITNIVFPELLEDRDLSVQHPMSAEVFLNGEYWYSTYILEKYNKYYMADTYHVNPENVIVIKDDGVTEGPNDAYAAYSMVRGLANMSDLSVTEEYEKFKDIVDIQSYIDYICANVYLCNMDMCEWKNTMCWRTIEDEDTEYGDSKWRWIIYDMDCIEWMDHNYYGVSEIAAVNSFTETMQFTEQAICEHWIYAACKNSPEFRKQFVLSFMDMANVNFAYENIENAFLNWNYQLEDDLQRFFMNRFDYIVPYMAEEFGLIGTLEDVLLKINDIEGGSIQLNTTIPDMSEGSWTGRYYTDYPITATAIPAEGYRFVGWSGSVISEDATIEADVLAGGIVLEAIFERIVD